MSDRGESNLVRLTGLWKRESKAGNTYYGGKGEDGTQYQVHRNGFKKTEKDADLVLYRVDDGAGGGGGGGDKKDDDGIPW